MVNVYIESMGCDSNLADSKKIEKYLAENGQTIVSDITKADYIILMSCGFNKIMLKNNITKLKAFRKTGAKIILGGCVPKIDESVCKLADYSFGARELDKVEQIFGLKSNIEKISPEFKRENLQIIKIATGCQGNCSYCAIKRATDSIKSRPLNIIIKDIKKSIKEGYSKIALVSEDDGAWGQDLNSNITELIKEINKIKGDFKITFTYFNPQWFIKYPALFKLLKSKKIEKTINIPVQSGSNKILKLMNRGYTVEQYLKIFNRLKREIPEIKIQVDVMVGFPKESNKDFKETLKLVKDLDIYYLEVFAYTDMKNTISEKIIPKVPFRITKERAKKIIDLFLDKYKLENRNLVNTNIKIK